MHYQTEQHTQIAPTKWIYTGERQRAAEQGTVFFYHGLGSSKDQQDKELYSLAEAGFLAIGVDNIGHGERRYPDFEQRFASSNPHWGQELLGAVAQSAQEFPQLVAAFTEAGLIDPHKMGLVGVSMGGYIAYAAALLERRLKAVSVILGSPYWWEAPEQSPQAHIDQFFPLALLSQNAGQDLSVSPQYARQFHQELAAYYQQAPERQAYVEYPESGHFMLEADWEQCWQRNLDWFKRWIH